MSDEDRKAIEGCAQRLGMAAMQDTYEDIMDLYRQQPEGQLFRDLGFACGAIHKSLKTEGKSFNPL